MENSSEFTKMQSTMEGDYEKARNALENLVTWYGSHVNERNRNEATTRLQLIDRLLFECLEWKKEDCVAEEPHGKEYTDYSLSCPRRSLIVEAKKEGIYFELPAGFHLIEYPLKSLCRDNPQIKKPVEQAMGYCQRRGTPLGAICNGHQLISFVASREDGIPPLEGKAVVFDSLDKMLAEFFNLWNYLSKPGVEEKNLQKHLLGARVAPLPAKLAESIVSYPGIKGRNVLQTDLEIVGELVIEDVATAREIETDFIRETYCSSGALSQYALTSRSILEHRYAALFDAETQGPTVIPATTKKGLTITSEILAESLSKRPIILLGDVGVGKTIFIRYLIKLVGAEVMKNAIALYVDLGSKAALSADLRLFFLEEIERQLLEDHDVDITERHFVRGVYHFGLLRFSRGIYADLKEADPGRYKIEEIGFLTRKIENLEDHLKHCLTHLSKGRKKQIVMFLDNADQRDERVQQQSFIIAQDLASNWPVTVFLALRPQTFHQSRKTGALSGYHPKAFSISPPRVDEVVRKRLSFALKIAKGDIEIKTPSRPISAKLETLEKYLEVLIYSFGNNDELIEFIDNICSGNIRMSLQFLTAFVGSGHVDTKKILGKVDQTGTYLVALHEFLRAVIYGNNVCYDPRTSPLTNVFDVSTLDGREHFLLPILIDYIRSAASVAGPEGFVETASLYEHAQNAGFTPGQIDFALGRALRNNLVEAEGRRMPKQGNHVPRLVRATTMGVYHITKLIRLFTYADAVIVDTPVLDEDARGKITDVAPLDERLSRAVTFCEYLDKQWAKLPANTVRFNWGDVSRDLTADVEKIEKIERTRQHIT